MRNIFEKIVIEQGDTGYSAYSPRQGLIAYGSTEEAAIEELAERISKQLVETGKFPTKRVEANEHDLEVANKTTRGRRLEHETYLAVVVNLFDRRGYLTVKEAAARLNVSQSRVIALIKVGKLGSIKLDNRVFVKEYDVKKRKANPRGAGRPKGSVKPKKKQ